MSGAPNRMPSTPVPTSAPLSSASTSVTSTVQLPRLWFHDALMAEEKARHARCAAVHKSSRMCKYWATGGVCIHGDRCRNRHVYDHDKMEVCEFFQVGECKRNEVRSFLLFFYFLPVFERACARVYAVGYLHPLFFLRRFSLVPVPSFGANRSS